MILRFEEIDATLLNDATLGLVQIEPLIEECSLLLKDLDLRTFSTVFTTCPGPTGQRG